MPKVGNKKFRSMKFRNFKMVDYVVYGKGSFSQLDEILSVKREGNAPMVYLLDHHFENNEAFKATIPLKGNDVLIIADVTHEPKTSYVDEIANDLKSKFEIVSGIIGIGGGSTMDLAKAVAIMMTNDGLAQDYQGYDLVKNKAVYKVGIPTLSGTGAEVSRTCVLTGPTKKLGMNSDYTPFDQIILDPNLIKGVPMNQNFYTGMDCYIHCIESLNGTFLNTFSQSYGEKALEMCREIYLNKNNWDEESDEKLMMASYAGGMSIAYSQVGVAHAISYGLSYLLGTKHGIGNCIVFNHLQEYYPEGVAEFHKMVKKNNIEIPTNVCENLSDKEIDIMIDVSLGMKLLWENALGENWEQKMTREKLYNLYKKF
jgi:3-deoxy-alpha-D-manno-octulosonate 8-oxidase